jgi:hypothetical protein
MNIYTIIYGAVLFFLLSPGVLFMFPSKNYLITLSIHAALFAIIWQLTQKAVYRQVDGFMSAEAGLGILFTLLILTVLFIGFSGR